MPTSLVSYLLDSICKILTYKTVHTKKEESELNNEKYKRKIHNEEKGNQNRRKIYFLLEE